MLKSHVCCNGASGLGLSGAWKDAACAGARRSTSIKDGYIAAATTRIRPSFCLHSSPLSARKSGGRLQSRVGLLRPVKRTSIAATSESPSGEEEVGLLEKEKTDAWLKYGHEPKETKPLERRAKWVRPGYKEPAPEQNIDRERGENNRGGMQRRIVARIQQAPGPLEVEAILNKLESTGLKIMVFRDLVKLRDVKHSKEVLDLISSPDDNEIVFSYNKLLKLLLEEKRDREAEQLVKEMQSKGVVPNEATYNILLTALVKDGRLKQADYHSRALGGILKRVAEKEGGGPHEFGFRSLMMAYVERGMVKEGLALLQKHQEVGLEVPTFQYNKLLDCCLAKGSLSLTDRVLEVMKAGGVERDIFTCINLLGLYAKKKLLPEAEEVLKSAIAAGLEPDARLYAMLMGAYSEKGMTEKANETWELMKDQGCSPNVVTFNILVDAYAKQGNMDGVEELLQTMEAEGVKPDVVTFTSLISAWARKGDIDKAEEVLERMLTAGIEPNTFTYTSLINGYAKLEMFRQATEVLERMKESGVKPNTVTYNALLTAYANKGLLGRAEQLLQDMESNGCPPNIVTYTVLLSEYYKQGKHSAAADLKEKLKDTEFYRPLTKRRPFRNESL